MTRRASVVIDFDVNHEGHAQALAGQLRKILAYNNVEVTVLDDGAPTLPAATATGPATSPRSKQ